MRTIVHIGQHKTGTTSIQHYLKNNRDSLAKEGLYVPDVLAGFDDPSHFILNVYALDMGRMSSMKEMLIKKFTLEFIAALREKLEEDITNHYLEAERLGCKDIVWTNEGLYLLNSVEEYKRLCNLFEKFSTEVVCVCCFREVESFRLSYKEQLRKQRISFNSDVDSYRYVEPDSWLFDYSRKEKILRQVFQKVLIFPYDKVDMIQAFMKQIGYSANNTQNLRMNVTKYT